MNDKKSTISTKMSVTIVCIVLAIIIGFAFFCNSMCSGTEEESESSKEIKALVCSESEVKDYLVSPSSAKFPYINSEQVKVEKIEKNKYFVDSYVDSENSFGAMIRTYYSCTVTLFEDDKYRVENLEFEE